MNIEERAKDYASHYADKYQVAMFKAYLDGATEQQKLDVDMACSLAAELFSRPTMKNFDKALKDFRTALLEAEPECYNKVKLRKAKEE